ncbi:MAG: aldehyde dehydrogenase family protein [Pseudomonadota bacterium]
MKNTIPSFCLPALSYGAFGRASYTHPAGAQIKVVSPIDRSLLSEVACADDSMYDRVVDDAVEVFKEWRQVPAPERGEMVRRIALILRDHKKDLGRLVSMETGKILAEGEGEVQEAIDIADFAVGLSRQLYGKIIQSERREHRMMEQWHPLGPVGVITAFNFPVAVWAWNAMVAAVCGDVVVWKPSDLAPLSALAANSLCRDVARSFGFEGVFSLVLGDGPRLGQRMAADKRIPLVSATGSCAMGRSVGATVASRLGRSLLELGGNNAVIVLPDADLKLATAGILFGAVGTAGQRCTSIRRILVHEAVCDSLIEGLKGAYAQVRIGNPLEAGTLMGPLIHERAVDVYRSVIGRVPQEGGTVICGGRVLSGMPSGLYVEPTIVKAPANMPLLQEENFVPIVFVVPVKSLQHAVELNNGVAQGLSSAIFTRDMQAVERFLSASGSDCGIANVNMGTSGAEIGGAFGGEKDTGGGRESGSDSWKQYMRRQTCNINYGDSMPLAQGVVFS